MFFLSCILIMSQVTVTTVATTSPVTVVWSKAALITMTVTLAEPSVGQITLGQQDLVLLPQLIFKEHFEGFYWSPMCATATSTSAPVAFSGICQICHGSSAVKFPFAEWVSQWFLYHVFTLGRHICILVMVCDPHQECTEWLLLPLPQVAGPTCCLYHSSPAILAIWWGIHLQELGRVTWSPQLLYMVRRGSAPTNDTVTSKSVMEIKPGDSGMWLGIWLMNLLTPG